MRLPGPLRAMREAWLAARYGRTGMPWRLNGVPCRIPPHLRAQLNPAWEPAVAAYLRERMRPGHCLFDVGANVGAYVIQAAAWTAPEGTIVAFEPNPGARAWLDRVIVMNGLAPRVTVERTALAATPGEATFHAAGAEGMSRLGRPNPELGGRTVAHRVPVATLDAWCARTGRTPDWLLIDVEGWEAAVLEGGRETIRRLGPQLGIVVEMHPNAWADAGSSAPALRALVARLGREARSLGGGDPYATLGHAVLDPA